MSTRGIWYVIQSSIPSPAWVRWPEQQRFCCCCSVRTGASLIGWFNFIVNSLYIGMLVLAMAQLRNIKRYFGPLSTEFTDLRPISNQSESEGSGGDHYSLELTTDQVGNAVHFVPSAELQKEMDEVLKYTLPIMYKSVAIPGIMVIFSILWLITVEANTIGYVRLFGRAFMLAIFVQILLQLGFLVYADLRSRAVSHSGINWIVWVVFAAYALLNLYFIPVIREYIARRVKENNQGLEQGLLTSEMYPKARIAEEYIEDAFTLEGDADVVRFQASLESEIPTYGARDVADDYQPL